MTDLLIMRSPIEARQQWPMIRDRLAAIAEACEEPWIAEDVFTQIVSANAYLWGTAELDGFLILQIAAQPYGRDLHCWICYNESGEPPVAYWDQLLDIARMHECSRITFENDRRGFERHIPGLRRRWSYSFTVT